MNALPMQPRLRHSWFYPLWIFTLLLIFSSPVRAQGQCGFAESPIYPIDITQFQLVQDFGVPSSRHQGRYHTGEDWYSRQQGGYAAGTPVRAIATGRVTFASPIGWGRDGGVVIIEHTMPDNSIAYSQYGHIFESDDVKFPPQWSCISQGEVIGTVGDVRPAPHLHLEIRNINGTSPGPGYSWANPITEGWRRPSKFIRNWQAWMQPAFRWRLSLSDELGPAAPPLLLDDNSLLYLDFNRLGRMSPDGRALWRINLERPAVGITSVQTRPAVIYADGSAQYVNLDGTLGERWETGAALVGAPVSAGDLLLFRTPDNALAAFDTTMTLVLWRVADVPPIIRSYHTTGLIALITSDYQMLTLTSLGEVVSRVQLREVGGLSHDTGGNLLAYTRGGLWRVLPDGTWETIITDAPPGGRTAALTFAEGGGLYLFDGRVLHAYDSAQNLTWQVEIPGISGQATLTDYGVALLLTTNHGHIMALQKTSGGICGSAHIYGSDHAAMWHHLGADGVLRVAVSDQFLGLDWGRFLGGCA